MSVSLSSPVPPFESTVHISNFARSQALGPAFHAAIPGGAHTYAKGDDQFPEHMAPYIVRGAGCRVWDADGNEFVEFGAGLRAVTLGHAYAPVVAAARQQMELGTNFGRPAVLELETAEDFLDFTRAGDMVKFAKNGSDVTSAAVKLARAYTGRDLVAVCQDQPFFSVDDWFIATTPLQAGIPAAVGALTVGFRYNDLASAEALFAAHPGRIACLLLETEKEVPPIPGFLPGLRHLCDREGAVLIFDEIITGFRWHNQGSQAYHGVRPDLSAWGKGLANGFSLAALTGRRELMELGGLHHHRERVFLLSTTYGAETHVLAAARAVMHEYRTGGVVNHLWEAGRQLARGLHQAAQEQGVAAQVQALGQPCCLTYTTRDAAGQHSAALRTLFLQETMRRGLLMPSLIVNYSHTPSIIGEVLEKLHEVLGIYRRALEDGPERYLAGAPVKSVYRVYN